MRRFPWWLAAIALGCGGSSVTNSDAPVPAGAARLATVSARAFTSLGRVTLFAGRDVAHGEELWSTDGTPEGTRLVKDIQPGPEGSNPFDITRIGGVAFFSAGTAEHGHELWRSDGTEAGTILVRDINPGPSASQPTRGSSAPRDFVALGSAVLFRGCDEEHGPELWRTDGTASGTTLVADIVPGPGRSSSISSGVCLNLDLGPHDLAVVDGIAYFFEKHPDFGTELWRSDGTEAGTWMVTEVYPGPDPPPFQRSSGIPVGSLVGAGGTLLFNGPGGLWASDGTADGTRPFAPVFAGLLTGGRSRAFFTTNPGIWVSDGTPAGTRRVHDVDLATDVRFEGHVSPFVVFDDVLFFEGRDEAGYEPWRSDGTTGGTTRVADVVPGTGSSSLCCFARAGDDVYFIGADTLWRAPIRGGAATPASTTAFRGAYEVGSVGTTVLVAIQTLSGADPLWAVPARR